MQGISKILTPNDTGDTGTHQAGICIPKKKEILEFFPDLNPEEKNPRVHLFFEDDTGSNWEFAFIYYNNKFFGGTRNEYRLTRVIPYINQNGLRPGDQIFLERDDSGKGRVRYERQRSEIRDGDGVLRLGFGWKVIKF